MPTLSPEERWLPLSGTRSKDPSSSSVITCETLSKVDWYSRPAGPKDHLHYYSDADGEGDGEGKAVSEAGDEHDGIDSKEAEHDGIDSKEAAHHRRELKEGKGKLDARRHGYAGNSSDHGGHPFIAPFPPPVYDKPSIAGSREAKKAERGPRTYPGAIPHSSNILSHSSILLPNYMGIHHAGSHNSNSHAHHKALASMKATALIPSHITGNLSKGGRTFNDTVEPSSPKVTCLGRVKIKHKCRRELGKLADSELQASALPNGKVQHSSKKDVNKVLASMSEGGQVQCVRGAMTAGLSAAPAMAESKKSKHGSNREDTMIAGPASNSDAKVKKGIRKTLKEAKSHMKLHRERKQPLPPNASMCAGQHVEIAIDLGRFCTMESMRGQEYSIPNTSVDDYDSHDTEFVPQVPPPNSLLLMRNGKSRPACTALNSYSQEYGVIVDGESDTSHQAYLSLLKGGRSMHGSSSLMEVKFEELEIAAMTNGHDGQEAYLSEFNVKMLCTEVADECKPLHGKKNAMAHRQASLPKEGSLWQRRCIVKPSDLLVGKPIALQVNEPTTR